MRGAHLNTKPRIVAVNHEINLVSAFDDGCIKYSQVPSSARLFARCIKHSHETQNIHSHSIHPSNTHTQPLTQLAKIYPKSWTRRSAAILNLRPRESISMSDRVEEKPFNL